MSYPTVRLWRGAVGSRRVPKATQRKQSRVTEAEHCVSVKKLYGAPLPASPVPFQSIDGVMLPVDGGDTSMTLLPVLLAPPGDCVTV